MSWRGFGRAARTLWRGSGALVNTSAGILALVANQLASWLTFNFRVKYHLGQCVCQATDGGSAVTHAVIVVEGGTPLVALSAVRKAMTWVLHRIVKGIPVLGLTGMSVGDVIFVQSGRIDVGPLMAHECGHCEQSRIYGPLYMPLVGLFTILGGWPTRHFEEQATRLGKRFRKQK